MMRLGLVVAATAFALVGGAEEVVIDPGAGVPYEQTEPITGDKSVRIKSGIITLNSANAYTGQTAATNAQLIVRADVVPGETSPVGTQGPVILSGPATIRAEGDKPILWTLPLTNDFFREDIINDSKIGTNRKNGSTWGVICFDTLTDMTLGGAFGADYGGFAKIGPGALHLATPNGKTLAKCNNSAPPSHYNKTPFVLENGVVKDNTAEAFSIYDGSVYMDALTPTGAKANFSVSGSKGYCYIGGMTAGKGEQEKSPYLEVSGTLSLQSEFCTPWNNGFADYNTPEGPTHPIVRVKNGGTLTLASSKGVNIGLNTKSSSSFKYRSNCEPEIIVEKGGTLSHTTSTSYRWLLPQSGGHRVKVTVNGTMKLPILSSGSATDAYQKTAPSDTSLDFLVGEGGVSSCARFAPDIQNTGFPNRFVVADGGQFTLGLVSNIQNQVNYSFAVTNGGILTVSGYNAATCVEPAKAEFLFDDGVLLGSKDKLDLFAPGSTIRIGKGGLTAKPHSSSSYTAYLNVPVSSADGCEGVDGGLTLCPGSASAKLVLGAAASYAGPTTLQKGTLALGANGVLPANGDLVFAGGNLVVTNGENVTVRNLTFADGTTATLKLLNGTAFAATGTVSVGDGVTLKFALLDETGTDVTPASGELAVMSVPAAAADELEKFKIVAPVGTGLSVTGRRVVVAEGKASLVVSVTGDALTDGWTNPAGGAWSVGGNWGNGVALPDWGTAKFETNAQDGGAVIDATGAKASAISFKTNVGGYALQGAGFEVKPFNGSTPATVLYNAKFPLTIGAPGAADDASVDWHLSYLNIDDGDVVMNSGRLVIDNELAIGDTWLGDRTSTEDKKNKGKGLHPSFTLNGGFIETGARFYTRAQPLFGTTTFKMNGGTIHTHLHFQCSRNASHDDYEVSTNVFNGGTLIADGFVYLGFRTSVTTESFVNEGATIKFGGGIHGGDSTTGHATVRFNGGMIVPTGLADPTANNSLRYFQAAYLGEKGLHVDMSELASDAKAYFSLQQKFESDPSLAAGTTDGGLTVRGRGTAPLLLGSVMMGGSTFAGAVHATDGAFVEVNYGDVPCPFVFDAGTAMKLYPSDRTAEGFHAKIGGLTLGEEGNDSPVDYILSANVRDNGVIPFVVDGALAVNGPVRVWTASTDNRQVPDAVAGEFVLFAYKKAESPTLDLAKFSFGDKRYLSATFTEEDVTEGDYAGYTLVRISVAFDPSLGDGKWISTTAGGAWSGASNWDGAVPNGEGKRAYFNPADGKGVAVSVDEPVTVGTLTFGGAAGTANGYVLSGNTLTLSDSSTPAVNNFGGTNTISAPLAVSGEALALNTATGTALRVNLNGVAATVAANDTIGEMTAGGNVELATTGFAGKLVTNKGRTVVDDLSFVKAADDLVLGPSTLRYEGGNVEIPGLTVNAPSAAAGVLDVADADTTVALNGLTVGDTGRSTFIKYGPGTLHLKAGDFTFKGYKDSFSGVRSAVSANGDSPNGAIRALNVDDGTLEIGTKDDPNDAPNVTLDMFVVGRKNPNNTAIARMILNNGVLNATNGTCYLHYYPGTTIDSVAATDGLTVNGGTLNMKAFTAGYNGGDSNYKRGYLFEQNGGVINVGGIFRCRYASTQTTTFRREFRFNGGELNVGGDFDAGFLGGKYNDTTPRVPLPLNVRFNGGTVNVAGDYVISTNAPSMADTKYAKLTYSRLYLNAGTLKAKNIVVYERDGSINNPRVTFNGGTYAPTAAATLSGLGDTALVVSTNGAVITTANVPADGAYTIADPLVHDEALAGADGGLVKEGEGTLVLAAQNTYTGPTVVKAGLLRVDGTASVSDTLVLAGGAVSLAAGGSFARVEGVGAIAGSVETAAIRPAAEGTLAVTGDFSCAKRLVVDLANYPNAKLGDVIELTTVSGAVNLQERCRVTNAADAKTGLISVKNGVVTCTLCDFGTVFLVK